MRAKSLIMRLVCSAETARGDRTPTMIPTRPVTIKEKRVGIRFGLVASVAFGGLQPPSA